MADRAEELGLTVPELGAETVSRLASIIPAFGAAGNPVDLTAQFIAEPAILRDSVKVMLDDPAVDIAVIWFQLMNQFVPELVEIFRALKAELDKPFIVVWVAGPDDGIAALHALEIAVLRGAEPAIDAVAGLVAYRNALAGWAETKSARAAIQLPGLSRELPGGMVPSMAARDALAAGGVPLVGAVPAHRRLRHGRWLCAASKRRVALLDGRRRTGQALPPEHHWLKTRWFR